MPDEDADLVALDASHLFQPHVTWIGFRRGMLLRKYMYDFVQLLAPHLDRRLVDRAHRLDSAAAVTALFSETRVAAALGRTADLQPLVRSFCMRVFGMATPPTITVRRSSTENPRCSKSGSAHRLTSHSRAVSPESRATRST